MIQPLGYAHLDHPQHICLLQKSIYGLKQALTAWFERFTIHILHLGFTSYTVDPSFFLHFHKPPSFTFFYMWMTVITGNSPSSIASIIISLSNEFDLKDFTFLVFNCPILPQVFP